jgi:hypothetical protein
LHLRELRFHSNELMGELPLDAFAKLRRRLTHVVLAPGNWLEGTSAAREMALRRLLFRSILIQV